MVPKVSVLIPSYNKADYIENTINSVLDQTFDDFELIILDDCSTDNSLEIIKSVSDNRIKVFSLDENLGVVNSLNTIINKASGEYIAVLGADDAWLPNKLEKQVAYLEENPDIAACFSWVNIVDERSQVIEDSDNFPVHIFDFKNNNRLEIIREFFFSGNHLCHSSLLIRSSIQREIGEYNFLYRQLHDFDLWLRILLKYNIYIFEEPLVEYRFINGSQNISKNTDTNNIRLFNEAKIILSVFFDSISDDDFFKAFFPYLILKNKFDKAHIVCEKFFLFQKHGFWAIPCRSLAFDYLVRNMSRDVFECLQKDYNFSIKDLYAFTGEYVSNYRSNILLEEKNLKSQIEQKDKDIFMLTNYVNSMKEDILIRAYLKIKRILLKH